MDSLGKKCVFTGSQGYDLSTDTTSVKLTTDTVSSSRAACVGADTLISLKQERAIKPLEPHRDTGPLEPVNISGAVGGPSWGSARLRCRGSWDQRPAERNALFFISGTHREGLWSEEITFVETFAQSCKSRCRVAGMPLTGEQRTKSTLVSHTEENTEDAETTGGFIMSPHPVPSPPGGPPAFPPAPQGEISWSIWAPNLGLLIQ